jgi:hypothetical protein
MNVNSAIILTANEKLDFQTAIAAAVISVG